MLFPKWYGGKLRAHPRACLMAPLKLRAHLRACMLTPRKLRAHPRACMLTPLKLRANPRVCRLASRNYTGVNAFHRHKKEIGRN